MKPLLITDQTDLVTQFSKTKTDIFQLLTDEAQAEGVSSDKATPAKYKLLADLLLELSPILDGLVLDINFRSCQIAVLTQEGHWLTALYPTDPRNPLLDKKIAELKATVQAKKMINHRGVM